MLCALFAADAKVNVRKLGYGAGVAPELGLGYAQHIHGAYLDAGRAAVADCRVYMRDGPLVMLDYLVLHSASYRKVLAQIHAQIAGYAFIRIDGVHLVLHAGDRLRGTGGDTCVAAVAHAFVNSVCHYLAPLIP